MVLRFCFRVGRRRPEPEKKRSDGLHVHEVDGELSAERLLDLLGLAGPHQAGVDEHAGELVTDRLVHEGGGDRRVDAAGERAEHPALPDLGADRSPPATRSPTCASSVGRHSQTSKRNRLEQLLARGRCATTSGWNWTP